MLRPFKVPDTLITLMLFCESSNAALTCVRDFLSTARMIFFDDLFLKLIANSGDAFAQPRIPMYSRIVSSTCFLFFASNRR